LWEQLRRSDHGAFDTLFRAHYAALVGVAERMLREREAAEEIVQDIYAEIWRRRETLVVEGTLRAYLFRSTRNRALNHIRHHRIVQKSEHLVEPVTPMPAPSESIREQEIRDAVQQAVATLPDRCREVFQLSREGGLRYTEIAESMGISVKTVEAQMGKALRILRERLSAWLVDPPSG
ncbi:MAG: RNA polymerase sigma-70 factor, partial [Gemmatimonadota bacterium]|nr:RNA polymerase sigma-70 factor [Gemmatimonadota bacterium]